MPTASPSFPKARGTTWCRPVSTLASADLVFGQATTVGAQAQAAGKQLLGLSFAPLVQRSGVDYGRLGLGTGVPNLGALPALLTQQLAAVRRDAAAAGPRGGAADR